MIRSHLLQRVIVESDDELEAVDEAFLSSKVYYWAGVVEVCRCESDCDES